MKKLIPVSLTAFIVALLLFSCSKETSVENGSLIPATGTIQKDSQNNCLTPTIQGTYYTSLALGDSNYVQIQVNVTKAGSYTIKTDAQNGFSFADSGRFSATGVQTIKLKGKGTPINAITTDFTVTFDSTSCSFSINVKDGGNLNPNPSDTAWQFSDSSGAYNGPIKTAYLEPHTNYTVLKVVGYSAASDSLQLGVAFSGTAVQTGTYTLAKGNAGFAFLRRDAQAVTIYSASISDSTNTAPPGTSLTIQINAYDNATQIVSGTFSGTAITLPNNTLIQFNNGRFRAKITP
jgi:hypothetical protein